MSSLDSSEMEQSTFTAVCSASHKSCMSASSPNHYMLNKLYIKGSGFLELKQNSIDDDTIAEVTRVLKYSRFLLEALESSSINF